MTCIALVLAAILQTDLPPTMGPSAISVAVNGQPLLVNDDLIALAQERVGAATSFDPRAVRLIDRRSGKTLLSANERTFNLSFDRRRFVIAEGNEIQVYDASNGRLIKKCGYYKTINRIRLLTSGGTDFAVCDTGRMEVQIVELAQGKLLTTRREVNLTEQIGSDKLIGQSEEQATAFDLFSIAGGAPTFKKVPVTTSTGEPSMTSGYDSVTGGRDGRYFASRAKFTDSFLRSASTFKPIPLPEGFRFMGFDNALVIVRRGSGPNALYDPATKRLMPINDNWFGRQSAYGCGYSKPAPGEQAESWLGGGGVVYRRSALDDTSPIFFMGEDALGRYKRSPKALVIDRELNGVRVMGKEPVKRGIKGRIIDALWLKGSQEIIGLTDSSVFWWKLSEDQPYKVTGKANGGGWSIAGQIGSEFLCYKERIFDETTSLAFVGPGGWRELPDTLIHEVCTFKGEAYGSLGDTLVRLDLNALRNREEPTKKTALVSICRSSYDDSVSAIGRKGGKLWIYTDQGDQELPLPPSAQIRLVECYPRDKRYLMQVKLERGKLTEEFHALYDATASKFICVSGVGLPNELTTNGLLVGKNIRGKPMGLKL